MKWRPSPQKTPNRGTCQGKGMRATSDLEGRAFQGEGTAHVKTQRYEEACIKFLKLVLKESPRDKSRLHPLQKTSLRYIYLWCWVKKSHSYIKSCGFFIVTWWDLKNCTPLLFSLWKTLIQCLSACKCQSYRSAVFLWSHELQLHLAFGRHITDWWHALALTFSNSEKEHILKYTCWWPMNWNVTCRLSSVNNL